jgi:hypothetical protein
MGLKMLFMVIERFRDDDMVPSRLLVVRVPYLISASRDHLEGRTACMTPERWCCSASTLMTVSPWRPGRTVERR